MMNNTSSTTICSNRRQTGITDISTILSGKKNSVFLNANSAQTALEDGYSQNPSNLHQNLGDISSDRQTLRMNDILKQIEAYSNDQLDKLLVQPQTLQTFTNQNQLLLQIKMAEKISNIISKDLEGGD